ncbi:early nodulin-like protein 15 [Bidens hawaiensis]|uniref:early nodulin-like protein 15 n=1 Tax=Bidens hawaiensis TaxID=980011 RepID=UPI00404A5426
MGSTRFSLLCFVTCLILFSLNFDTYEATEFPVGGKENSWSIPTSPNALNVWAQHERFKIGDSLVFKYDSKNDSVLQVEEGDYKKCIRTKPIQEYKDGNTVIKVNESAAFFFISGADGHCEKGEKLEVIVLSHKHSSPPPALSPNESPAVTTPVVEAPKSSAVGLDLWIVDVFIVAVATLVGISMF